jgi:DNA repair protein SbcC/Rad50
MLPLQLTLKNFMSYGEEPTVIDLRGMPVVCLSGDNGHGKSAILDAVTWALWGETRLGKQNHDQLIRLGADEMAVVLEFQEGDEQYRVRRQRSRRVGAQLWEIQIREPGGAWRPISGQSSGDTGRAIVQLLRMNYETFLNSAYLRQGRADEFVRQTANKRKDILAEILDLSRFDDLEARARIHQREAADRATDANRSIQQIEAEIGGEETAMSALAQVLEQIAGIQTRIAQLNARNQQMTELGATLAAQRAQLTEAETQLRSIDVQIRRLRAAAEAERAVIANAQKLLADREQIEREFSRHEAARASFDRLQDESRQFRELDRRRVNAEHHLQSERREIERALSELEKQRAQIGASLNELPAVRGRLAELTSAGAKHSELTARRQEIWDGQAALANTLADLRADYDRCGADLKAQQERLDAIAEQGEACSICGSPLPPDKLEKLIEECASLIEQLEARLVGLKHAGTAKHVEKKRLGDELTAVQDEIARLEKSRGDLSAVQQRVIDLERLRDEKAPALDTLIASQRGVLLKDQYAQQQRAELAEILSAIDKVSGADQELTAAVSLMNDLSWTVKAHAQLQSADRELAAANERVAAAEQAIKDHSVRLEAIVKALEALPDLDKQIAVNARDVDAVRQEQHSASEEVRRAQHDQWRLQHQLDHISKMRAELIERKAQYQQAKNDEDLYLMLAGSFGKRGVQALIIENALPELEQDANDLLGRLTDDHMRITIQTTRVAKSKTVADAPIETLDIAISDDLGDRPLEMYSGGESFRVSFALRIALSKLLTRRAGAHLQTLIIDEGFGTQDAKGREKLVESILAIQSEFAQIIVITHIDELKDAFPNRIEVVKTPAGSEVSLTAGAALG